MCADLGRDLVHRYLIPRDGNAGAAIFTSDNCTVDQEGLNRLRAKAYGQHGTILPSKFRNAAPIVGNLDRTLGGDGACCVGRRNFSAGMANHAVWHDSKFFQYVDKANLDGGAQWLRKLSLVHAAFRGAGKDPL